MMAYSYTSMHYLIMKQEDIFKAVLKYAYFQFKAWPKDASMVDKIACNLDWQSWFTWQVYEENVISPKQQKSANKTCEYRPK